MAVMHGKLAAIYWDSQGTDTNLQFGQLWNIDMSGDVAEITSMQDTFKTYHKGFIDWTANVTCLLDATNGVEIPFETGDPNGMGDVTARLELYLVFDTGDYKSLYGECVCNGIASEADKDGIVMVTYTFQGSGEVSWDTGAGRP